MGLGPVAPDYQCRAPEVVGAREEGERSAIRGRADSRRAAARRLTASPSSRRPRRPTETGRRPSPRGNTPAGAVHDSASELVHVVPQVEVGDRLPLARVVDMFSTSPAEKIGMSMRRRGSPPRSGSSSASRRTSRSTESRRRAGGSRDSPRPPGPGRSKFASAGSRRRSRVGAHRVRKNPSAPANLPSTTSVSVTGEVRRISNVPLLRSSAKSRMAMIGTTKRLKIQK